VPSLDILRLPEVGSWVRKRRIHQASEPRPKPSMDSPRRPPWRQS